MTLEGGASNLAVSLFRDFLDGSRADGARPPRPKTGEDIIARFNRKEFTAKLKLEEIDYKKLDILVRYLNPIGKIDAARRTGANRKQQARIVQAIKRARYLGLLPYTINDTR